MGNGDAKNREIERLRAIAVLMTIACHLHYGRLPQILSYPWAGVDLFFVISGYVLTRSFVRLIEGVRPATANWLDRWEAHRPILAIFYIRRAYRILPLSLLVAVAWFLWEVLAYPDVSAAAAGRELLAIFGGIHNYWIAGSNEPSNFPVYWSLAVEEHFYLFFPFLFVLFAKPSQRLGAAIVAMLACALVIRPLSLAGIESAPWTGWRIATHLRFDGITCGVVIALLRERGWGMAFGSTSRTIQWAVLAGLLLLWVLPSIVATPKDELVVPALLNAQMLVSGLLVFAASMNIGHVLAIPGISRVLEHIGSRSYALYLSHWLVANMATTGMIKATQMFAMNEISNVTKAVFVFSCVFLAAELLYRFVEWPMIARGARRIARLKDQGPKSTDAMPPKVDVAA